MNVESLPNFCAWLGERFGRDWQIGKRGFSSADFRIAKRQYEAMIGCRVYGHEYLARFYGVGA